MRSGKGHDGDPITSLSRTAQAVVLDVLEARAEHMDLPAQDPLAAPVDDDDARVVGAVGPVQVVREQRQGLVHAHAPQHDGGREIGRASCRERV